MVVESDSTATAACPPDRPVLAEVAVVLGPQLILGTVAVVVAVERLASIVGRIVLCESFDNVELDEWVLGEAVKSEVGVAGGVVFRSVVDDTALVLADVLSSGQVEDEQIRASFIALASDKVPPRTEHPV